MRKLLYGRHSDKHSFNDSRSPDTLPLIYRSTTTYQEDSAFGAGETETTMDSDTRNTMTSPFHLLNDDNSDARFASGANMGQRNIALGDDSGNAENKTYSSLAITTKTTDAVLPDASAAVSTPSKEDAAMTGSRLSWVLAQKGRMILLFLAVVYGSLNISMRLVFARPDPPTASASSTIQGWFAVVCFLPLFGLNRGDGNNGWRGWRAAFANHQQKTKGNPGERLYFWRFALELAFFNFGTQALINMSLVATQGARASFLVQMSVVFTPVVEVVFGNQKVSKRVWIGCFVALAGLFVLSYSDEGENSDASAVNQSSSSPSMAFTWGDWCCLLAALCWSLYIYRLSAWGEYFDETVTQFVKNVVLATLYTLWMILSFTFHSYRLFDNQQNENTGNNEGFNLWKGWRDDPIAWIILFYSALGPCTLADVFQQKAQATVPAAETNVILSLEPVFTTLLGFLLLGEAPSLQEIGGGFLIMVASVVASFSQQQSSTAPSR